MITLREYQTEAIAANLKRRTEGITRQLVSLPTGTGKTVIFAALAKQLDTRTLIIAHREELINQAVDKCHMVWPEAEIGVVMAENDEPDKQLVVGSVQSCCRDNRLDRLREQDFKLLIIDEAHHAPADTYRKIIEELGFMAGNPDKLLLGFTATAARSDKVGLDNVFQEIVFERSIATMIKAGYLADLRGIKVKTKTDLTGVTVRHGDFAEGELANVVNTPARNRVVVKAYLKYAADKKAVAFTANVQHAMDLANEFTAAGIRASAVCGAMSKEERRDKLQAFTTGELPVLTNCNLLTEGFDEPAIAAILMTKPTKSNVVYTQAVGRGTRLYPGKSECMVLDFCDTGAGICTLGALAGLSLEDMPSGQSIREAVAAAETRAAEQAQANAAIHTTATTFDLLEQSRFVWVPIQGGHFRLTADKGLYIYLKNTGSGKYSIGLTTDTELIEMLSDMELPLGYAQGLSEDWAKRNANTVFADKNAGWRGYLPTESQLAMLASYGIKPKPNITRGEASDLISAHKAKQAAKRNEPATAKQIYALRKRGHIVDASLTKGEAARLFKQAAY